MTGVRRFALVLTISAAVAGGVAAVAVGDGGPSPGIAAAGAGVAGPGGALRYVAVPTDRGTLVEAIRTRGGQVLRWTVIRGAMLGVPYVTNDFQPGGLSRDLRTLVLSSYAGPSGSTATRFAVLDTRSLRLKRMITLRGTYAFDALAPDGSMLYAIQYTSSQDWNRYRVRAYDLVRGRLLAWAIVDKREPAEQMAGSPMTRATSRDGAWAYTLYAGPTGAHFIHALDTVHRTAFCIDLPWRSVAPGALAGVRMTISGRKLVLRQRPLGRLAAVDTTTFTVRPRPASARSRSRSPRRPRRCRGWH
jgi:hypothetical protein